MKNDDSSVPHEETKSECVCVCVCGAAQSVLWSWTTPTARWCRCKRWMGPVRTASASHCWRTTRDAWWRSCSKPPRSEWLACSDWQSTEPTALSATWTLTWCRSIGQTCTGGWRPSPTLRIPTETKTRSSMRTGVRRTMSVCVSSCVSFIDFFQNKNTVSQYNTDLQVLHLNGRKHMSQVLFD